MESAVILSAVRTPAGSFGGQFKDMPATALGARAGRYLRGSNRRGRTRLRPASRARTEPRPPGGDRRGHRAGGPGDDDQHALRIRLKAVAIASQMIRAADVEIVVAGGMENMTRAPYLMPTGRFGARMGDAELIDSMVHDGLRSEEHTS